MYYSIGSHKVNFRTDLSFVQTIYEDRQRESVSTINEREQNSRANGVVFSSSSRSTRIAEEGSSSVAHAAWHLSNAKVTTRNCKKAAETKKNLQEGSSADVVDLTHLEELEPLDFKEEEKKLARNMEYLKERYPESGSIMYRYFLLSIALVEKFPIGSEYGVYDENYNNDGKKDEDCFYCSQQLRGKVFVHQCQCGHLNVAHIECFHCIIAYRLNDPKKPGRVRCFVCPRPLFSNHPVLCTI